MERDIMKLNNIAVLGSAAILALSLAGQASAADIKERTLRFSFLNAKEHPQGMGAAKFAELVNKASGGKITVKLFPSGVLGGDVQTVSSIQGGTLDFTVLNSGLLSSNVKELGVFDLPFLFNSGKEADAIVDSPIGSKLLAKLQGKGMVGLGYWELGFRHLTNNVRPVVKMEEHRRPQSARGAVAAGTSKMFSALGANPVPMPFTELYTALEPRRSTARKTRKPPFSAPSSTKCRSTHDPHRPRLQPAGAADQPEAVGPAVRRREEAAAEGRA
jgi:TRAP-type C4-dicarboxylate transport system substrate-binding protein